jgi:acyl-CoA thioester hydrolase
VAEPDFRFSTEVKVRFSETDAQGVAHHAAYLDWLEVARVEYLARFPGGYQGLRDRGIEATTLEAYVRYRAPARFDDNLVLRARCGDVRGARFRFEYVIERDGEKIADGWTAHACVDAGTLRPTRMPEWLKEELARAETDAAAPAPAASSAGS